MAMVVLVAAVLVVVMVMLAGGDGYGSYVSDGGSSGVNGVVVVLLFVFSLPTVVLYAKGSAPMYLAIKFYNSVLFRSNLSEGIMVPCCYISSFVVSLHYFGAALQPRLPVSTPLSLPSPKSTLSQSSIFQSPITFWKKSIREVVRIGRIFIWVSYE